MVCRAISPRSDGVVALVVAKVLQADVVAVAEADLCGGRSIVRSRRIRSACGRARVALVALTIAGLETASEHLAVVAEVAIVPPLSVVGRAIHVRSSEREVAPVARVALAVDHAFSIAVVVGSIVDALIAP